MTKPKLVVPVTNNDKIIEGLALLGLIMIWAVSIYYYNDLPESVPRHFNALGEPDAYGNRNFIWTLPIMTTVLYIGLTLLTKVPHTFNYPIKITPENAPNQYHKAVKMMRLLKTVITLGLTFMAYKAIQVALGNATTTGNFTLIIFIVAIFAVIAWYMFKTKEK